MNNDEEPTLTLAQTEEVLRHAERLGLMEKVRDQHGNVVTKPGKDGKPQIMWRRTAKGHDALH